MEKAQLPKKGTKENRKAAIEIPISGYLLLGWTGGCNSLESQTQLSFHLAQEFTAKHHLFIKLFLESSPELTKCLFFGQRVIF